VSLDQLHTISEELCLLIKIASQYKGNYDKLCLFPYLDFLSFGVVGGGDQVEENYNVHYLMFLKSKS